jgi:ABC-type antimicrobial peptide transport system permease subunit
MVQWQFIRRSLIHHWRINFAVALGVAAATAVLTGALLIGDSMRGSLKDLTLGRLGQIDELLITQHFFREQLVAELQTEPNFKQHYRTASPAILFPQGTLQSTESENQADTVPPVAGNVLVLGVREEFWRLDLTEREDSIHPLNDQIVLNQTLADELQVNVGDLVTLRLPDNKQVSADSSLGNKEDRIRSVPRLFVSAIIPATGFGRFSLSPSQQSSRNAFVNLAGLQKELGQQDKVNTILVASGKIDNPPNRAVSESLQSALKPTLEDYGLLLNEVVLEFNPNQSDPQSEMTTVARYHSLSSQRMMLDDPTVAMVEQVIGNQSQTVLTYLANAMMKVPSDETPQPAGGLVNKKRAVQRYGSIAPYSLITAVDSNEALGPLLNANGKPIVISDQQVVISDWLANDLQIKKGDWLRVDYFDPETTHGEREEYFIDLEVLDILPLTAPRRPYTRRKAALFENAPTLITDPALTPDVPGVTDQASINDWDLPFPLVHRIRGQDDNYWNNHRTTPKAFVNLAVGQRLWGSRFGNVTSVRFADDNRTDSQVALLQQAAHNADNGNNLDMQFVAVKRNGLAASSGSTPFDGLFLGLSLFVIAAALMLIVVLFRLGIQQRASQIGLLLALGLNRKQTTQLWVGEAAIVASVGAFLGCGLGIGYGKIMLAGLSTWWVDAIVTSFLEFHISSRSLVVGYSLGVIMSVATIAWAIRATKKVTASRLLGGNTEPPISSNPTNQARFKWIALILLATGILLAVVAAMPGLGDRMGSEGQAGAFVGGGFSVLSALLLLIRQYLRGGWNSKSIQNISQPLAWLAARNAGRNPSRSALTIGLMAMASFLLIAMGSFKLTPSAAGKGGFDYWGLSSMPVYENLGQDDLRISVLGKQRAAQLENESIQCLRYRDGDDASCSNVYQARQPRVLGVPQTFVDHYDHDTNSPTTVTPFTWATQSGGDALQQNPWHLLDSDMPPHAGTQDDPIPVVIDKNTAMYSLKLYLGTAEQFDVTYDNRTVTFQVAGLLSNSILQGSLLINEKDFTTVFPKVSGYRFLLATNHGDSKSDKVLETHFNDQGLDMQSTQSLLESLLAVQNTYISAFQSLGALGLLLGTFGLATVQLRSILERRKELALMRAAGFGRRRLAKMVLWENLVLLLGGLATGILAAAFAVVPHMFFTQAAPPGSDLVIMIGIILIVGMVAGLVAVRATLQAPLISSLRGE